jgi:hypothetical protein
MKLEFRFERGGTLEAELDLGARETVRCVGGVLPLDAQVLQARWSGREIFVPVNLPAKPPRERQTIRASLGDIIYFREWEGAFEHTGFEAIGLFYGPEIVREWRGDAPVNVFGRIHPDHWERLKEIGDRVWRQGGEAIHLRVLTP